MCGDQMNKTQQGLTKQPPVITGHVYKVKIENKSARGDGIAKIKNFVIFIPNTNIGDFIKIRIRKVTNNCAFGDKADDNAKTFLLNRGPLVPHSDIISSEGDLISRSPWSLSNKNHSGSKHGTIHGKCKECGGAYILDSKENCLFCQTCGLVK